MPLFAAALLLGLSLPAAAPPREGFGSQTPGAAAAPGGEQTYRVTTLADAGPGSLRDAVAQSGRRIVFDVGGEIVLAADLLIRVPYLTIDGATAPAPGITIRQAGHTTAIEGSRTLGPVHDVIVRHLTFDNRGTPHGSERDILGLDGERSAVHHVLIEHCTGRASGDGVFDVWGQVHDVTIAWNILCDTETALHLSTGDLAQRRERITFHHNLLARNNERQIRLRHAAEQIEWVNNLVVGWGGTEWGGSGLHIAYDPGETNPSLAAIGNWYQFVPARTAKPDEAVIWERGPDEGRVYFRDNRLPPEEADAQSNVDAPGWPLTVRVTPVDELPARVLADVGPVHRDAATAALLAEAGRQLGVGPAGAWRRHVIDDASQGADGVRLTDVNADGLPDIATGWEQGDVVRVCVNPGPARAAERWPAVTVGRAGAVEDAVCVDLDGDGAVDVVSCSEGKTRAISVHWGPREPAQLLEAEAWQTETLPEAAERMMWMFALPMQVDGRRGVDLVAGGKGRGAAIGWFESPEEPRRLADWKWHPLRPVGWLMSLVARDMDGDGDEDLVFSDRKGRRSGAWWLEHPGVEAVATHAWDEHALGGGGAEAMFLQPADVDRDGLEDVLLAVRPKALLWLQRLDGSGRAWRSHSIRLPDQSGTAKAVQAADLDADGDVDLVVSCEEAEPPLHGLSWFSSSGPAAAGDWQPHTLSGADGVKHDLIAAVDLDGDGDLDVLTTEEVHNLGVIWYENPSRSP